MIFLPPECAGELPFCVGVMLLPPKCAEGECLPPVLEWGGFPGWRVWFRCVDVVVLGEVMWGCGLVDKL